MNRHKEFGLSDVGLRKICVKRHSHTPGRPPGRCDYPAGANACFKRISLRQQRQSSFRKERQQRVGRSLHRKSAIIRLLLTKESPVRSIY